MFYCTLHIIAWCQKRKATSSKSLTRQHRGTSAERAVTWQQEAENVLQMIVDSPDSVPFRNAVNIEEFPVYNMHPISLELTESAVLSI